MAHDFFTAQTSSILRRSGCAAQDVARVTRDDLHRVLEFLSALLATERTCAHVARLLRPILPVLYATLTASQVRFRKLSHPLSFLCSPEAHCDFSLRVLVSRAPTQSSRLPFAPPSCCPRHRICLHRRLSFLRAAFQNPPLAVLRFAPARCLRVWKCAPTCASCPPRPRCASRALRCCCCGTHKPTRRCCAYGIGPQCLHCFRCVPCARGCFSLILRCDSHAR